MQRQPCLQRPLRRHLPLLRARVSRDQRDNVLQRVHGRVHGGHHAAGDKQDGVSQLRMHRHNRQGTDFTKLLCIFNYATP